MVECDSVGDTLNFDALMALFQWLTPTQLFVTRVHWYVFTTPALWPPASGMPLM
jgi:hypothetical protein